MIDILRFAPDKGGAGESIPTIEYTRGPDMDGGGLLYTSRSESVSVSSFRTLHYNFSNGRGDIVAQADQYASLTWTASDEAYGKRTRDRHERGQTTCEHEGRRPHRPLE